MVDSSSEVIAPLTVVIAVLVFLLLASTSRCSELEARYHEHMKTHVEEPTDGR